MNITITTPQGVDKTIEIGKFSVLEGWDIQSKFFEFATSVDQSFRRAYTMEVLRHAEVVMSSDRNLRLATAALVSNHLCSPENIMTVFEAVLRFNKIEPNTHAILKEEFRTEIIAKEFVAKVGASFGFGVQHA